LFTGVFETLMIGANITAIAVLSDGQAEAARRFGVSLGALMQGEVWRLVTASLLSHDPAMLARQILFAALVLGLYEWRWGWHCGRRSCGGAKGFGTRACSIAPPC
jgi:hypothetical protein